jgi:hypothetical protein
MTEEDAHSLDPQEVELLREVERNFDAVVHGTGIDPEVRVLLYCLGERKWLEQSGDRLQPVPDDRRIGAGGALCRLSGRNRFVPYAGGW